MGTKPPQTYVFDLDGVIYRGNEVQPHAVETVRELRRRGRSVLFFTNNSTKSRENYRAKLAGMGVPAATREIMTSAYAAALYLLENGAAGRRAYVVGESGLVQELSLAGIEVLTDNVDGKVDYVVVGLDRRFDYGKLARAQQAILGGARFVATNRDATFPIESGTVMPGCGAIVSAIETASGVTPVLIGKPETYALKKVLDIAASKPQESVIVGDRLETDILLGNRIGMRSVLVLTGVSDMDEVRRAPAEMRPQRVISDLIELLEEDWSVS